MKYVLIVLLLLSLGCDDFWGNHDVAGESSNLPANATNITSKGNGWYTFELDGKKFLCCSGWQGYQAWIGITEVSK